MLKLFKKVLLIVDYFKAYLHVKKKKMQK